MPPKGPRLEIMFNGQMFPVCRTAPSVTFASKRTGGATTCSASTASTSSAGCASGIGAPTAQNTTNAQGRRS